MARFALARACSAEGSTLKGSGAKTTANVRRSSLAPLSTDGACRLAAGDELARLRQAVGVDARGGGGLAGGRVERVRELLHGERLVAGAGLQPDLGEVDELAPAGRDEHELRAALHDGVLHTQRDDLVRLLDVPAHDHDGVGVLDVGVGRGQAVGAKRVGERRRDGAVDRSSDVVEVWRADDLAREAREQRGFLVRGEWRAEHGNGVRAVLRLRGRERAGGLVHCLVGRDGEQSVAAAGERAAEPLAVGDGVVVEAAAHADLVAAGGVEPVGPHDDRTAVARAVGDGAADGASVARRVRPLLGEGDPLVGLLHQRRRWADIDAGAAEVAVGLVDGAAGAEGDHRRRALAREADRAGVAQVGAGAHAARADDAHLRVELEERVGAVGLRRRRLVVRALLADPRLLELTHVDQLGRGLELAAVVLAARQAAVRHHVVAQADLARLAVDAAVAGEAAVGVVRHDQRHHLLARALDLGLLGIDDHAVVRDGGARELQRARASALDLDDAGAAAGVRLEAVDVAEVRDANALLLDHFDEWDGPPRPRSRRR